MVFDTQDVPLRGARWHWSKPQDAPPALVLGYGPIAEPAIRSGLEILGSLYQALLTS